MTPAAELLRIIARGVEVGHSGRVRSLKRGDLMTLARDYCDGAGLTYSRKDLKVLRTDPTSSMAKRNAMAEGKR